MLRRVSERGAVRGDRHLDPIRRQQRPAAEDSGIERQGNALLSRQGLCALNALQHRPAAIRLGANAESCIIPTDDMAPVCYDSAAGYQAGDLLSLAKGVRYA
jgi:hypothetical protein